MSPEQVRRLRQRLKLTQEAFAEVLHVSRETVARWEVGMSKPTGLYLLALKQVAQKAKGKNESN